MSEHSACVASHVAVPVSGPAHCTCAHGEASSGRGGQPQGMHRPTRGVRPQQLFAAAACAPKPPVPAVRCICPGAHEQQPCWPLWVLRPVLLQASELSALAATHWRQPSFARAGGRWLRSLRGLLLCSEHRASRFGTKPGSSHWARSLGQLSSYPPVACLPLERIPRSRFLQERHNHA